MTVWTVMVCKAVVKNSHFIINFVLFFIATYQGGQNIIK